MPNTWYVMLNPSIIPSALSQTNSTPTAICIHVSMFSSSTILAISSALHLLDNLASTQSETSYSSLHSRYNQSRRYCEWLHRKKSVRCCTRISLNLILSRISILTRDIDIANMSVCPSVRPSVRPLRSGNRWKRFNISFRWIDSSGWKLTIR